MYGKVRESEVIKILPEINRELILIHLRPACPNAQHPVIIVFLLSGVQSAVSQQRQRVNPCRTG